MEVTTRIPLLPPRFRSVQSLFPLKEALLSCLVSDMGLVGVPEAEQFMSSARELRKLDGIPDLLLFLTHPRTVALGARDRYTNPPRDLLVSPDRLRAEGIALARSVRGGGITYHWPGQVVCYPVLALRPQERDIGGYMAGLQQVAIEALRLLGMEAQRRKLTTAHLGLWIDQRKIVSMGVRVSDWITSFGFAINLAGDHSASRYVRPCGLEGVHLVTVEEVLGCVPERVDVVEAVKSNFSKVFGRRLENMPPHLCDRLWQAAQKADIKDRKSKWHKTIPTHHSR